MKLFKTILFSFLWCISIGQVEYDRFYIINNVDDLSNLGGLILQPDHFFEYSRRHELMDVFQRGIYWETDTSLVLVPFVPTDSINIVSVFQIGMADSGKTEVLFFDVFNNPLDVVVSVNCRDWEDTTNSLIISDSEPMLYIKSSCFEFDYLKDVMLRSRPYDGNAPVSLPLDCYSGEKIKVILSEELDWIEHNGKQWWTHYESTLIFNKTRCNRYVSTDGKILLRKVSARKFTDNYDVSWIF